MNRLIVTILVVPPLLLSVALAQSPNPPEPVLNAKNVVVTPAGGTSSRTIPVITGETLSLQSLGAVCDGTTDDSAAVTAALATNKRIAIPGVITTICNAPSISSSALMGAILSGPGRIKTSDGKLRGSIIVEINSAPSSSAGINTSVVNAFNGDTSKVARPPIEVRITGALTAGNPSSPNYVLQPEISADMIVGFNSSGVQTGTSGRPFGRTGIALRYTAGTNSGLGDFVMNWVACTVSGSKPGMTTWVGGSECGGLAGSVAAGVDNAYLQPIGDLDCNDNGFDVSCIGVTMVMNRTNDTAALGNPWVGHEIISFGTKKIDAAYSATGPMTQTYDCLNSGVSDVDFTVPCLVMGAGMRIYGAATNPTTERLPRNNVLNGEYIEYSATTGWSFFKGGVLQFATGGSGPPLFPSMPASAPSEHCALWDNAGVVTRTTCP